MTTNSASTPSLMITMMVLTVADSLAPRISNSVHMTIKIDGGQVDDARVVAPSGGSGQRSAAAWNPNEVVQQLVQVAAPSDGRRRHRDAVFQQQACGHAHRDDFAHAWCRRTNTSNRETGTAEAISA